MRRSTRTLVETILLILALVLLIGWMLALWGCGDTYSIGPAECDIALIRYDSLALYTASGDSVRFEPWGCYAHYQAVEAEVDP